MEIKGCIFHFEIATIISMTEIMNEIIREMPDIFSPSFNFEVIFPQLNI
jgi:hypothetical protein